MTRTQTKVLITEAEAEAYSREAARFNVAVAVWAVQVLRSSMGLEAMDVPRAKVKTTKIPSDSKLDCQFKIRLTGEEINTSIDAAGAKAWSEWVRDCLRERANVR